MPRLPSLASLLMVSLACVPVARGQEPPASRPAVISPEAHLGRPVGTDFQLADYGQVAAYYRALAASAPTVRLETLGKTTEGRDFLLAIISSEANLRNLDTLRAHARTLHDPRGKSAEQKEAALRDGKVILVITPAMHSTEIGATEMAMSFAHQLATSDEEPWKSARDNAVIYLTPNLNPDGLDQVATWYRKNVNTPHETASLPRLYQHYTGHDNNRDWFMMTQPETRMMSRLLYDPRTGIGPNILWDVHQQGNKRERMFIPPYRDPLNPNIDPAIVNAINLLGTRAALDMQREGFTGVATGSTYDMWWHGGNRTTPARHNVVGILTECASANLASPVFQQLSELRSSVGEVPYGPSVSMPAPWWGGWWRFGDIVRYELAFGRSLLAMINREPRLWRETTLAAAERAVRANPDGVKGWLVPADNRDPTAVRRLVDALLLAGVELHTTTGPMEIAGRTYGAGSILIRRDQPYGAHVKDLFELQKYPELKPPYDVAGWTLPLLMGITRVEILEPLAPDLGLTPVSKPEEAMAAFRGARGNGAPRLGEYDLADSGSWTQVARDLKGGKVLTFQTGGTQRGRLAAGDNQADGRRIARPPRIGIYSPHTGVIDEGWLRYVFDSAEIPYNRVGNERIRAGELLKNFDVLLIADMSANTLNAGRAEHTAPGELTRGLAPEGTAAIEEFVRRGGNLITFNAASNWAIKLFRAPLVATTISDEAKAAPAFACPGSVLRSIPETDPLTVDLPASLPLFFSDATAWREMTKAERDKASATDAHLTTLLRYAPTELLLSGYIAKPQILEGHAAWVRLEHGEGRVHLFAFNPHYRSWTQATIPLIFRAAFLEPLPAPEGPTR